MKVNDNHALFGCRICMPNYCHLLYLHHQVWVVQWAADMVNQEDHHQWVEWECHQCHRHLECRQWGPTDFVNTS